MAKSKKPLKERIRNAEEKWLHWQTKGDAALVRGEREKAKHCYAKRQFWHSRWDELLDNWYS